MSIGLAISTDKRTRRMLDRLIHAILNGFQQKVPELRAAFQKANVEFDPSQAFIDWRESNMLALIANVYENVPEARAYIEASTLMDIEITAVEPETSPLNELHDAKIVETIESILHSKFNYDGGNPQHYADTAKKIWTEVEKDIFHEVCGPAVSVQPVSLDEPKPTGWTRQNANSTRSLN